MSALVVHASPLRSESKRPVDGIRRLLPLVIERLEQAGMPIAVLQPTDDLSPEIPVSREVATFELECGTVTSWCDVFEVDAASATPLFAVRLEEPPDAPHYGIILSRAAVEVARRSIPPISRLILLGEPLAFAPFLVRTSGLPIHTTLLLDTLDQPKLDIPETFPFTGLPTRFLKDYALSFFGGINPTQAGLLAADIIIFPEARLDAGSLNFHPAPDLELQIRHRRDAVTIVPALLSGDTPTTVPPFSPDQKRAARTELLVEHRMRVRPSGPVLVLFDPTPQAREIAAAAQWLEAVHICDARILLVTKAPERVLAYLQRHHLSDGPYLRVLDQSATHLSSLLEGADALLGLPGPDSALVHTAAIHGAAPIITLTSRGAGLLEPFIPSTRRGCAFTFTPPGPADTPNRNPLSGALRRASLALASPQLHTALLENLALQAAAGSLPELTLHLTSANKQR
jgi:hypothetical protein